MASDTSYTVTGLTPDHDYTFRVRAICDVDDTSMSISTSARTLQSCFRPVSIAIDSVLGDTVWVSWVDTTNTMLYDLVYGPAGFDPDTAVDNVVTGVSDSTYMFYGLTMGLRYDFYVRVDCGSEQSSWVGPASAVPSYHYTMAATGSDTIHVCGYTIYDDGGADGNYSNSCNSTLVVYPNDPTMSPVLSGVYNTESSWDYIYLSREETMRQAIDTLTEYDQWFAAKVQEGRSAVACGDVVGQEDIEAECAKLAQEIIGQVKR